MKTEIRRATLDDIPHLARFQIEAYGGYIEVLYEGLGSGLSPESLILSQFEQPNTTPFFENHWVAVHGGQIAGGMHAFPMEDMAGFIRDPVVPEDRHEVAEEFLHHLTAPGTYYIHVLVVYPEFHRKGIASAFLSLALEIAREKGFAECSLCVFEENVGALALYKKHGFRVADRYAIKEHPLLYYTGNNFLMTRAV